MNTGKPLRSYAEVKEPRQPKPRRRPPKVNPVRKGHRFPHLVNLPLRAFTRTFDCVIAGRRDRAGVLHICRTAMQCCHLLARGAGGPDENNTFPGCDDAHREQQGNTKEFEWFWRIRLKPICRQVTTAFWRAYPELRKRLVAAPCPEGERNHE